MMLPITRAPACLLQAPDQDLPLMAHVRRLSEADSNSEHNMGGRTKIWER